MFRLGLILMTICLAASLVLAATYKITAPLIQAQKIDAEKEALKEILPQADDFLEKQLDNLIYYEAIKHNRTIGYVLKARSKGYSGNIDMLVGIDRDGIIQAVEILSQTETPGLGSRIVEVKQGQNKPWFLEQFKAKSATDLNMSDIQAITGATISSRVVLEGVKEQAKIFLVAIKKVK